MKKTVTIQEAIKANEHSRVRRVGADKWKEINYFYPEFGIDLLIPILRTEILAEWEIEEKPLEIWVNIYYNNVMTFHSTKELAESRLLGEERIRCVKMREVDDVEGV